MLRSTAVVASVLLLSALTSVSGTCGPDSLPCDDGRCVRREDWCDGKEACADGSDEAYCGERNWWGKSPNKCDEKLYFRCEDGLCWPSVARCDGTADCRDGSDEDDCNLKVTKAESSEEKEEESKENKDKSKESSEENGNEETTTLKATPSTTVSDDYDDYDDSNDEFPPETTTIKKTPSTTVSDDDYDFYEDTNDKFPPETTTIKETPSTTVSEDYDDYEDTNDKFPPETTTKKEMPPPTDVPPTRVDAFRREFSPEAPLWSSTPEEDFYARKMERNGQKRQHSTQISVPPTRAYRPPPVRPAVQRPSRQFSSQYTTSRKPAVPYTGPTRPYTPRPYRYIGSQVQYGGRYPVQQPPYPPSGRHTPYYSQDNNYLSSQPNANHRQRYRNSNGNNGRTDWRNGVSQPPRAYGRQLKAPSRFYFRKNYNEIFGRTNYPSVRRGAEWILSIRNASGGWGKETPRALVALSLVNNSFLAGSYERDLMQKYFQVHLGVNLLKEDPLSLNRLAMSVNALIATCQDPRDFQGWDLTELIRNTILKLNRASRPPVINPLVYLSLCLADRNLTHYEVHHLMTYLVATRDDEATRDMQSLALEAFACHAQRERYNAAQHHSLQRMVWNATSAILRRMRADGSFGSVYSTALAAQALMSVNDTVEWNPEPTFRFLKSHQERNGSFGDFLATYHALPALSGRSLLHLRNTDCNPPRVDRDLSPLEILQHPGPKQYIRYSLHLGSPLSTGYTVQLLVPRGVSFFDVMRVAAHENEQFRFSYEEVDGKVNVYSIADLPNDPEQGVAWRLYVRSPSDGAAMPNAQQLYTGDIREFLPTSDQHIVFWYHPLGVRF